METYEVIIYRGSSNSIEHHVFTSEEPLGALEFAKSNYHARPGDIIYWRILNQDHACVGREELEIIKMEITTANEENKIDVMKKHGFDFYVVP